jgi:hypothetical protein
VDIAATMPIATCPLGPHQLFGTILHRPPALLALPPALVTAALTAAPTVIPGVRTRRYAACTAETAKRVAGNWSEAPPRLIGSGEPDYVTPQAATRALIVGLTPFPKASQGLSHGLSKH